jgi:hypothetical protein
MEAGQAGSLPHEDFSTERIGPMFEEYYQMLLDLSGDGWYAKRPARQQLDWLRKSYPATATGEPNG